MAAQSHVGSDGTTLTFASDAVCVETPWDHFDSCQLWVTRHEDTTCNTYFKKDIGIVKQERIYDGITEVRLLKAYHIAGGKGLLPCAKGNTWEYASGYHPDVLRQETKYVVCHADDSTVILSGNRSLHRLKYDENSWLDMIQQIRNEYFHEVDGKERVCDVSHAIERAEALATTPMEKAHTKAACSVARRIMSTDPEFNPDYTESGHWNFFSRNVADKRNGKITFKHNFRWSFELKNIGEHELADTPLLYNDVYGILQDAVDCIWSEDWKPGTEHTIEFTLWGAFPIKTTICCEDAGTITTPAGNFENCMKLSLNISNLKSGLNYRTGKKEYYFAPGIGIVRTVNYYYHDVCKAVYELTSYQGTGDGYMPMANGMLRRYEAIALTDGYVGSVEYHYISDDNARITIFADRCGVRKRVENTILYSTILGERIEEDLWEQGKHDDSRLRHDVNNLNLLLHFLGRPNRNWAAPEKAAAWHKYRMNVIEFQAEGNEIPRAWLGCYADSCFAAACAMFGYGNKEEGYEYLDRAFTLYPKWLAIPKGEALEVGNEMIYGGVRVVKNMGLIELPDGTREPMQEEYFLFNQNSGRMYYGMTAPQGWEWFDGVRNEDRFKEAIERARKLMETYSS